jgi:hypothetical protein
MHLLFEWGFMFAEREEKRNESSSKRLAVHTYFDKDRDRVTKQFGPPMHQLTNSTTEEHKLLCNLSYGSLKNCT